MAHAPSHAEQLFATWLRRSDSKEPKSFEDLIRSNPELAEELRDLRSAWERWSVVLRLAGISPTNPTRFAQRFREAHGPGLDPEVSLEGAGPEGEKGTSGLLRRLDRDVSASRYRLEGEVARGGMGAVLRVWDEDIRRHLAMKVVLGNEPESPEATPVDSRLLARFLEEAQITGQLDHPGIVPVHELGLDQRGRVFFTMKLVKGQDLRAIYQLVFEDKQGWNETRALNALLKVCEAVAYAHKKGVIHRDLKPGNVMVGDFGEVYVMDWGLARVLGRPDRHDIRIAPEAGVSSRSVRTERREEREESPDSPIITMDGDVVGTPAYMPPEQARGEVENLNPRSDVYAIGAMLYHLLARQPPYVPPGARMYNRDVLALVKHGPPTPLYTLRRDAPVELVAIVEKAMDRDAAARYADTRELAEDLRAYLEHRVVRAHRTGLAVELRKWVRRNRAVTAALVMAVSAGSVAVASALQRAESDRRAYLLGDARTADGLRDEVERLWPALPSRVPELEAWITDADGLASRRADQERLFTQLNGETRRDLQQHARAMERLLQSSSPAIAKLRPEIEARFRMASTIEEQTVTSASARERWDRAVQAIASDVRYGGLRVRPQIGLLPLESDPASKLWEFWHVLSGDQPVRDPASGKWRITPETGIVLVLLPGGHCTLGSLPMEGIRRVQTWEQRFLAAREHAQWREPFRDPGWRSDEAMILDLELDPFFISKYEMTQAQWMRVMRENPSQQKVDRLTHPVETISWDAAQVALHRVALELPTEAQWEYACRAGTTSPFWSGWEIETLLSRANIADIARSKSGNGDGGESLVFDDTFDGHADVSLFEPNPFGLHSMHGNVWEWCRDGYRVERQPRRGDGLDEGADSNPARSFRGGSFNTGAIAVRSSARFDKGYLRTNSDSDLGVRPIRALAP